MTLRRKYHTVSPRWRHVKCISEGPGCFFPTPLEWGEVEKPTGITGMYQRELSGWGLWHIKATWNILLVRGGTQKQNLPTGGLPNKTHVIQVMWHVILSSGESHVTGVTWYISFLSRKSHMTEVTWIHSRDTLTRRLKKVTWQLLRDI